MRGVYTSLGLLELTGAGIPKAQACIKKDGRGTIKAFRTEYNIDLEKRMSIYFTSWVDKKEASAFSQYHKGKAERSVAKKQR